MSLVLSDLISPNRKDISVPGKQSQTIDFQITMPEKLFSGILLGGVTIRPVEIGDQSKGGIQNVYMHTIAIRVNETAETIPQNWKVVLLKLGKLTATILFRWKLKSTAEVIVKSRRRFLLKKKEQTKRSFTKRK